MHLGNMKSFPQASSLNGLECTKEKTSARRPDQESLAPLGMCRRVGILTFIIDDNGGSIAELTGDMLAGAAVNEPLEQHTLPAL